RRPEHLAHRPIVRERPAKLTPGEGAHVTNELLWERAIEAVLGAERLPNLLNYVKVVDHRAERIAGREMDQQEGDRCDDGEDHRRLCQSSSDVAEHPL